MNNDSLRSITSRETHKYQQHKNTLHKKVQVLTTGYQEIKGTPQSPASNGAINFKGNLAIFTQA